jgi:hypothetical protein
VLLRKRWRRCKSGVCKESTYLTGASFESELEKLRVAKIVIPGSAAREINRELSTAGIDEITTFLNLDGLGGWLAMVARDESGR